MSGLARLSATEGAFAALRPPVVRSVSINTSSLLPTVTSTNFTTRTGFQVGGRTRGGGDAGLRAQVEGSAGTRLSFD